MTFNKQKLLKIASAALIMLSFATAHAEEVHQGNDSLDAYTHCQAQADCDKACMVVGNSRSQIRECDTHCDDKCPAK